MDLVSSIFGSRHGLISGGACGLLWLFFVIMAVVTAVTQREEVWLFMILGFIYMVVKAPPKWLQKNRQPALSIVFLAGIGFWQYQPDKLIQIGWFFTKAGAFVFGSGLAIIPFLQAGVVNEMGWLNEQQFLDSVAVAMITPGPVVITVGFIGFLVAGFAGAVVAALGVFLPCYVFTVLPASYFKKISKNNSIKAFVDGITAAVVGALVGSVFVIAGRSIADTPSAIIAVVTILSLVYIKKLQEPYIILIAAIVGIVIKYFF